MPIYEYRCQRGHLHEELREIPSRREISLCLCGHEAELQISAPYVSPESLFMDDPITGGKIIHNKEGNPWEGSGVDPDKMVRPDYISKKIQVDRGSKTNVAAGMF